MKKLLFTALVCAMIFMLLTPSTVALVEYKATGTQTGYQTGMETTRRIATLRAVAVTNDTLIVDGTLVNMSTFTLPGTLDSQAVFAGLFYRRTDNFTSYTIHYALMNMTTFMERHREGEWEELSDFSNVTAVENMTPDDMKDLVKDRSKMMELMRESKEVCGEATENGVIQVFRYFNGTVYIHVTDNTNGTIKELVEQRLGIVLQQYGDSPVTWYNVTTSDVVNVNISVATELLSDVWGDRGGLLPKVLEYIDTENESLKTYFGIHEAMFVTPGATIDFCSFIGATMSAGSFDDFTSYLDEQGFSLRIIVRSIVEGEEGEYSEEQLAEMRNRLHGPAVEKVIDAIGKTARISVNECILVNLENGKLEIEKEGHVLIKVEAKGNATLVSRAFNASDIQEVLRKLPKNLTPAVDVVLEINSEELSGNLTIKIRIPENISSEDVKIAYYDEQTGTWNTVPTSIVVEDDVHYAVAVTTHTSLWTLVITAEKTTTTETSEGVAGYPTSYIAVALIVIVVAVIASYLVLKQRK